MNPFEIEFIFDGLPYRGLVARSDSDNYYAVQVESENQEFWMEILANPCGEDKMEWCLRNRDKEESASRLSPGMLQEIGEAIEKYESLH